MSEAANRRIVEAAIAQWQAGDGAAIFRILADDVRWTVIGSTAISKTYTSRRQFIDEALKPLSARLDGVIRPEIVGLLAEGDTVVLQWNGSGRLIDGSPYRNSYCWVMKFRGGKVAEGIAYLDTALVDRLLAVPAAG